MNNFGNVPNSTPNTEPLRLALRQTDDATTSAVTASEAEAFTTLADRAIAAPIAVVPGTPAPEDPLILSFFPTAEGYFDYENMRYIYQYKDQLGNVRLSFTKNKYGVVTTLDRNDYYPFGMSFLKTGLSAYDPMAIPYNYKYNGKELQETGFYDFGARMYMPDVGRWTQIDPLSEEDSDWSPYKFGFNNPLAFTDPTGMAEESTLTDFKLKQNGEIERVNPLDGSEKDKSDTLYATDSKGNVDKSKSVTVQKANASDSSVISELSQGGNPLTNDMLGNSKTPYFSEGFTQNINDAVNVYNFLNTNTRSGIEFSLGNYNVNGQNNFQIATMHDINSSEIKSNRFSNDNLVWSVHNHDGEVGLDYKNIGNQWNADKSTMYGIFRSNQSKGLGDPRFFTVNDNNVMIEISRAGVNRDKPTFFNLQFIKNLKRNK